MTEYDTNARDGRDKSVADDHTVKDRPNSRDETHSSGGSSDTSRRDVLKSTGALGVGAFVGTGASTVGSDGTASATAGDPWTIVAIPDTQYMTERSSTQPYAESITDWVVDNADTRNIAFVTHEGDMVADGSDTDEWDRADSMMRKLDGVVPYSPNVGNHDYAETFNRSSGAANFREYFGPSRFEGRDYFGGASPNERNFYQYFSAGGYEFLHLSLEFEAPGDPDDSNTPIGWAQDVLDDHPEMPTILTTHTYLGDDPRGRKRDVEEADGDGNSGQQMWEKLVRPNPQIFMVLNGHNHDAGGNDDGEHHQVSTNSAGENVYEMLANFQDYPNGGDGWFRRIRFVPGGGTDASDRIEVRTYTAYHDEFQTSDRSEFGFDLDLDSRFDVSETEVETATFQQRTDGYTGTVDTQLHEANGDTEYSDAPSFTVDGEDDGGAVQALVRFNDIIGNSDGQVPSGATVRSATLSIASTDPGDGATLHRMQTTWRDTDTWNDWGGIQADGTDAAVTPDAREENARTGTITLDVTESVQAWADGEANNGWAFLPLGTNGWDFESAEGSTPPELTVYYEGDGGCAETGTVRFVSASEEASRRDQFGVERPGGVQEGDVLVLTIGGTANGEDGMPYDQTDRWTRIDVCSQADNGEQVCQPDGQDLFLHTYYRVATGDEPAEYTINSGGNTVASIAAFRGADTFAPIESVTGLANDGDYRVSVCPSTDGVDGGMLVCGITHDDQHYIDDLGELTLRSEDTNPDSSTQVLTKPLNSGGETGRHEVGHVDPTGNKDISMSVVVRPAPTDCEGEGIHAIDDSTVKAVWNPDFTVKWPNYVYFGATVDGEPRGWQLMDRTDGGRFETTLGDLSAGSELQYQFAYYARGWEYTDAGTYTFDPGGEEDDGGDDSGESGPGTNRLVDGEGDRLLPGEYLESTNGDYRLYLQDDGNLVLRDANTWDALWASGTAGDGGTRLQLQGDGNLVIYTDSDDPVWASDTAGSGGDELTLEDDGTLVLFADGSEIWRRP